MALRKVKEYNLYILSSMSAAIRQGCRFKGRVCTWQRRGLESANSGAGTGRPKEEQAVHSVSRRETDYRAGGGCRPTGTYFLDESANLPAK